MADHKITNWCTSFRVCLTYIATLVTMIVCGIGVTRYLLSRKIEATQLVEDSPKEHLGNFEPPTGPDLVTLG